MPTISANESDLVRLVGTGVERGELLQLLPLAKAELDGEDDGELRIELQDTNRPDLWSAEGVARQLRAHRKGAPSTYAFFDGKVPAGGEVVVDAALETVRPVVGAFMARGVAVDDATLRQIIQTQEKLCEGYGHRRREAAMGVYDASAIRFPVRYRAVQPEAVRFVPLGAEEEMTLAGILDRHPKGQEYRHLVQDRSLYPLLTDAGGTVLSFPPVINSRALGEVEVGDDHLFVEVTGHDMRTVAVVLNIMAVNLADRGWEIVPVTARFPYATALGREVTVPVSLAHTIEVRRDDVNKFLGLSLDDAQVCRLLASYGVRATAAGGMIRAACPSYRADYMHARDVIEDIAIAHGYDNFRIVMPETFTVAGLAPLTRCADRVRQELVGYGFQEVFSNVLMSREETRARMRLGDAPVVEIANFVSETYSVVRDRLLASLLRVEAHSTKALYPHHIFEVGEVAVPDARESHGSATQEHAAALIASQDAGFSEVQSYLDALMYFLARPYRLEAREAPFAIEGRAAAVLVGGREVGIIAEIHPEVIEAWGLEVPAACFEINLSALV